MERFRFYWEKGVIQDKIRITKDLYELWKLAALEEDESIDKYARGEEWFVEDSPLDLATRTGILNCNGIFHCKTEKL